MRRTRNNHYLLLLTVALMACPLPSQASCDVSVHPDGDRCHTGNALDSLLPGSTPDGDSTADDCCKTGCQDCGLPCCTGVAMIVTVLPTVDAIACVRSQQYHCRDEFSSLEPDPLDHPPRV